MINLGHRVSVFKWEKGLSICRGLDARMDGRCVLSQSSRI